MTLKIWVIIFPSITLFLSLFGPALAMLPLYQRTFILTVVLVPWMVFIGLPLIDTFIHLFSKNHKGQL